MIKLAQNLPWFGAQPRATVATAAFWQWVAVVVLQDRRGANHRDTLQSCPTASAAVLGAARMETFCKYAHPVLLGTPATFSMPGHV